MAIDAERLKQAEAQFGDMFFAPRVVNSPMDASPNRRDRGCDRMNHQDYAPYYAQALPKHVKQIVEMGIFQGHGLAMWSVLYPESDIIGLDIDPDRYLKHKAVLESQGAFPNGDPKVLCFDELSPDSWKEVALHLEPESVDVWVDDAIHRTGVIIKAWNHARKYIRRGGVYIIEDNDEIPKIMREDYDRSDVWEVHTWPHCRLTAMVRL